MRPTSFISHRVTRLRFTKLWRGRQRRHRENHFTYEIKNSLFFLCRSSELRRAGVRLVFLISHRVTRLRRWLWRGRQGRHREESLICCKTKNTLLFLCDSSERERAGVRPTSFISHRVTEKRREENHFPYETKRTLFFLCGSSERTRAGVRPTSFISHRVTEKAERKSNYVLGESKGAFAIL